jgi:large-conductance mechanosensitive channel
LSKDSNKTPDADSNNINTKSVIAVICLIVLVVVGFYFVNFHYRLSEKNEVWGTFGDYFGGILNPVIAAFAFYLIAKTYELQKRELEAARSLLKVSTDAQKKQIQLAALTALLNSYLMKIDMLNSENINLHENVDKNNLKISGNVQEKKMINNQSQCLLDCIDRNSKKINKHNNEVGKLEEQINGILKDL